MGFGNLEKINSIWRILDFVVEKRMRYIWICKSNKLKKFHQARGRRSRAPHQNGSTDIVDFPNWSSAKLILLGDKINCENQGGSVQWWPTAITPQVQSKLYHRIINKGFVLLIVLATCIALVSEIYTTTAVLPSETSEQYTGMCHIRLCHNCLPISDFGVAKGAAHVTSQDRIAYYNVDENRFMMGQDPLDHYWIYFITVSGEEYFLDCGMMTFNLTMMVKAEPYCKYALPELSFVPAYFYYEENK